MERVETAGAVFALTLAALAVPALVKLRRGRPGPRLAGALVITALLLDVAFTGLALAAQAPRASARAFANVFAFQIVTLPALLIGVALHRRSR